ncbi:uncharacterized protein K452DRAFT_352140 [Aplosporella prunicola CBS 121167]|uniref:Radical SAM core domain-containing protein n=1 Tax=Aplosporella prunicola CBS 121167 TaxID=1176127 RepID=A0A6A6B881_9PEZI|nr:uncharacterized protein K452DRAFT_352140 [Aplosporella prunicola CBS 121167]KAF2140422.1 hypothetical protein K452DRAFT_352140 [Aplosporella prunicola CBS 121167]
MVYFTIIVAITACALLLKVYTRHSKCPVSVNYHFSRRCNKSCGFCFHTATTSHTESLENAKRGLCLLKDAGMRKINFAGGEPFLYPDFLGHLVNFCKEDLALESVSIVTNGSLVKESFLRKSGHNIDILAVSCDSFDEDTNMKIGRGSGNNVQKLYRIRDWCKKYGIKFKINTVVCKLNTQEDMNHHIAALQPFRWKCFQVLMVKGENESDKRLRDVRKFLITDDEYACFFLVAESNQLMAKSYLILDEYMRFLDRDGRAPSASILQVGVQKALESLYWDEKGFNDRGGVYEWSRESEIGPRDTKGLDW